MKRSRILTWSLFLFFMIHFKSWALLPRTAVTEMNATVYGLYTTKDPTCRSDLVATLPLSSSPKVVNMVDEQDMGDGLMPYPVKCVIMVMKNQVTMGWKAGNGAYDDLMTNGKSDKVCNSGGSTAAGTQISVTICGSGQTMTVDWPAQITTDMASAGLTRTTTCTAGAVTGSEIIAVYLSTNAACTANTTIDAKTSGCLTNGNPASNPFNFPLTEATTSSGVKLLLPEAGTKYKFVVDPDSTIGNQNDVCSNINAPTFAFKNKTNK